MVVVPSSVIVWLTLPLTGRGISRPLTLRLVLVLEEFELSPEEVAGEELKESSDVEDSDEAAGGATPKLWTGGLAPTAAV